MKPRDTFLSIVLGVCAVPPMAAQQAPDALDSLLDRAQQEQRSGLYAQAASDYAQATTLDAGNAELWANRGVMEQLAAQYTQSVSSLKHALALKPALFTPTLFLGLDYLELAQPAAALPCLEDAHSERPADPQVNLSLGRAHMAMQQPRAAAAAYTAATQADANNAAAWYGLGISSLALIDLDGAALAGAGSHAPQHSPWPDALYADELLTQGRIDEAVAHYESAAADATPAQRTVLSALLAQARQSPGAPAAAYARVQPLFGKGQPDCPAARANAHEQPACEFLVGHYDASAQAAARRLQQSPSDAEALFWSVKANERLAVDALARFEELAPQAPATFDLVGDLYRRQGQTGNARAEYRKALSADEHDPAGLLGLAAADFAEGQYDGTTAALQVALADRPNDPALNLLMAHTLVEQHRFAPARPFLEKSLNAAAGMQPLAHALLGQVDAEEGRTAEAIRQMQLGLPSDQDGSLNFQLSRLYRRIGDKDASQRAEAQARLLESRHLANARVAVESAAQSSLDSSQAGPH